MPRARTVSVLETRFPKIYLEKLGDQIVRVYYRTKIFSLGQKVRTKRDRSGGIKKGDIGWIVEIGELMTGTIHVGVVFKGHSYHACFPDDIQDF